MFALRNRNLNALIFENHACCSSHNISGFIVASKSRSWTPLHFRDASCPRLHHLCASNTRGLPMMPLLFLQTRTRDSFRSVAALPSLVRSSARSGCLRTASCNPQTAVRWRQPKSAWLGGCKLPLQLRTQCDCGCVRCTIERSLAATCAFVCCFCAFATAILPASVCIAFHGIKTTNANSAEEENFVFSSSKTKTLPLVTFAISISFSLFIIIDISLFIGQ